MTGRRSHGRLSALNGVVHQGSEHTGDAASVRFFAQAGLDYVSASPYQIPTARLAAAHAALHATPDDR